VTNRGGRGIGKRPAKREGHDFRPCRKQRKTVAPLEAAEKLNQGREKLTAGAKAQRIFNGLRHD
jgi:hypothetical protein